MEEEEETEKREERERGKRRGGGGEGGQEQGTRRELATELKGTREKETRQRGDARCPRARSRVCVFICIRARDIRITWFYTCESARAREEERERDIVNKGKEGNG